MPSVPVKSWVAEMLHYRPQTEAYVDPSTQMNFIMRSQVLDGCTWTTQPSTPEPVHPVSVEHELHTFAPGSLRPTYKDDEVTYVPSQLAWNVYMFGIELWGLREGALRAALLVAVERRGTEFFDAAKTAAQLGRRFENQHASLPFDPGSADAVTELLAEDEVKEGHKRHLDFTCRLLMQRMMHRDLNPENGPWWVTYRYGFAELSCFKAPTLMETAALTALTRHDGLRAVPFGRRKAPKKKHPQVWAPKLSGAKQRWIQSQHAKTIGRY